MSILTEVLKTVTPVVAKYAKDTVKTVFKENPASEKINDIANTAIDVLCVASTLALSEKERQEEVNTSSCSSCTDNSEPVQIQYIDVPVEYSYIRQDLQNRVYDHTLF